MADKKEVKFTSEEAKEVLAKEQQENEQKCVAEVTEILKKYNCDIMVAMLVTPQGNAPQIQITTVKK